MDHATSLIEMFIPNGCCLPNGSLKIYFVLEAEEDFLPILPTIGDARLGCTTLVSQESASLFGRFKLCGDLTYQEKWWECIKIFGLLLLHRILCNAEWVWFPRHVCWELM